MGYLDHPPAVALLIWLGTNLFGNSDGGTHRRTDANGDIGRRGRRTRPASGRLTWAVTSRLRRRSIVAPCPLRPQTEAGSDLGPGPSVWTQSSLSRMFPTMSWSPCADSCRCSRWLLLVLGGMLIVQGSNTRPDNILANQRGCPECEILLGAGGGYRWQPLKKIIV